MNLKNIKVAPLLLSASVITLTGLSHTSRADAVQLNLNSPEESIEGADFAVPFDSTLEESGLVETTTSEASEFSNFNCNFSPEGSNEEVQPEGDVLSHLGPNLVAQATPSFEISQAGPIISETCELEGAPVGGPGGAGFPLAALAGLPVAGLIPLLADGGDDPSPVPEPIAIPFIFSALGIGGVLARKRFGSSQSNQE